MSECFACMDLLCADSFIRVTILIFNFSFRNGLISSVCVNNTPARLRDSFSLLEARQKTERQSNYERCNWNDAETESLAV